MNTRTRWPSLIAICLIAGYFALTGEAIHCQYFQQDDGGHHETSPRPMNHATHCLVASHSATVAINSLLALGHDPLEALGSVTPAIPTQPAARLAFVSSARAPPAI